MLTNTCQLLTPGLQVSSRSRNLAKAWLPQTIRACLLFRTLLRAQEEDAGPKHVLAKAPDNRDMLEFYAFDCGVPKAFAFCRWVLARVKTQGNTHEATHIHLQGEATCIMKGFRVACFFAALEEHKVIYTMSAELHGKHIDPVALIEVDPAQKQGRASLTHAMIVMSRKCPIQ